MQIEEPQVKLENWKRSDFYKCWKLHTKNGRQYWSFAAPEFLKNQFQEEVDWNTEEVQDFLEKLSRAFQFDKQQNPNTSDLVLRGQLAKNSDLDLDAISIPEKIKELLKQKAYQSRVKGFDFYASLQTKDGNWSGDYGGPLFLLPGLIIVSYITETSFHPAEVVLMKRYMLNHQNKDGGWGLHIEDDSTLFGTVLQYVALRLLGESAENSALKNAREWILKNGGATAVPLWGKFYLSVLGVYEWEGNNSFYPEAWLLPRSLPLHPGRYWNHARMVYMPMSYCYAVKLKAKSIPLTEALKEELYTEDYDQIDWKAARDKICEVDLYKTPSAMLNFFNGFLNRYEKIHSKALRKRTIDFLEKYIEAEDRHTNYINVGPVNQVLNSLCVWHYKGKDSSEFKKHVERWKDYLWVAEDGMKMNGYNGSQLWDTTFAAQALLECQLENSFPETTRKIYKYLDQTQIQKSEPDYDRFFRDDGYGCWPFSTQSHDWPITDCTSEAMKSALLLEQSAAVQKSEIPKIDPERYRPAVDFLLKLQNKDGGWATYENSRGPKWLEKLNPSGIFADIMVEYSYVECTSATMQALKKYHHFHPNYHSSDIQKAIVEGEKFIRSKQRNDGSWYGSWAVCFTYGTWFGIEGLLAGGANDYTQNPDAAIQRACEFLVGIQKPDGSWGESYRSCVEKEYVAHEDGQIVNTAWALLALMAARYPEKSVIEKGIQFLLENQEKSGDWPQQSISGVFNGNCMITYTAYRNVFPLWALGRFQQY